MLLKFNDILEARRNGDRESGFTLIELLVVIIIIGILAAVAVPIYLNQQKTARDSATTSDVKNLATNVQSALVKYPDARYFNISATGVNAGPTGVAANTAAGGTFRLWVGNSATDAMSTDFSVTQGTALGIRPGTENGTFVVNGFNASGKNYTANTATNFLSYDSGNGGLLKTSAAGAFTAPAATPAP